MQLQLEWEQQIQSEFLINSYKINKLYIMKASQKKSKSKDPSQLFENLTFILLTDNLSKRDIENLSIQILQHGGNLQTVQCGSATGRSIKADYLLCDPRLDASEIRENLQQSIKYKDAIDLSFIQASISVNKILPSNNFKLRINAGQKICSSQPRKRVKLQKTQQKQQKTQKVVIKKQQKKLKDITKISNNKFIIDQLSKLLKVYSNEGDKGRKIAYSRAIASIKSLDKQIETEQDVDNLKKNQKHIGDKIVDKIKELLKTGSIRKLQQLKNTQQNIALEQITRVWGIGSAKAKEMYQRGIRTIDDLRQEVEKNQNILTKNQKIGLKYVEDLQIRIPRKKITLMAEIVKQTLYEIVGRKDLHDIQVCGSYRRGKETCGDMDIFITRKDGEYQKMLLTKLVQKLTEKNFLTDHLTMPRHLEGRNCQSYMGICHYKDDLHHRIDIKYYPIQQFAFAVLYFTGSDMFNRKMRLQAMEQGYHLSDHGMHKTAKNSEKGEQKGPPIKCKTQKQIFDVLGIQYKEPKDRDV